VTFDTKMSKSQTSVEFIVIVAAILIIVLVLITVFDPLFTVGETQSIKQSKLYWKQADIFIGGYYTSGGDLNVTIQNNVGNAITLINITFDTVLYDASSISLAPGARTTVQSAFGLNTSWPVEIWYTNDANAIDYVFIGAHDVFFGE
jgi:hypothetical protein